MQKGSFLVCQVDGVGFRVVDGIPHMLPEDAVPAEQVETEVASA